MSHPLCQCLCLFGYGVICAVGAVVVLLVLVRMHIRSDKLNTFNFWWMVAFNLFPRKIELVRLDGTVFAFRRAWKIELFKFRDAIKGRE